MAIECHHASCCELSELRMCGPKMGCKVRNLECEVEDSECEVKVEVEVEDAGQFEKAAH